MRYTALILMVLMAVPAWAGFVAYPMETRLLEADLVAVGTVGKTKSTFKRTRDYALATMQITDVVKGNKELKTVDVAFAAKSLIQSDRVRKDGDTGLWLMRLDDSGDFYWIDRPSDLQSVADKDKFAKQIEKLGGLEWGPAVEGLQALVRGQLAPDVDRTSEPSPHQLENPTVTVLQVFIKNSSDKPICICDFAGDKPVKLQCQVTGGPVQPIDFYGDFHATLSRANFITLHPGQVRAVGGTGGAYRLLPFTEPGDYTLTATYTATRDGKAFQVDNVWTGQLTSAAIKIHFKAQRDLPAR